MKTIAIVTGGNSSEYDISVKSENNYYLVEVDYEVRLPYFKNIDLLLSFNHKARAQGE